MKRYILVLILALAILALAPQAHAITIVDNFTTPDTNWNFQSTPATINHNTLYMTSNTVAMNLNTLSNTSQAVDVEFNLTFNATTSGGTELLIDNKTVNNYTLVTFNSYSAGAQNVQLLAYNSAYHNESLAIPYAWVANTQYRIRVTESYYSAIYNTVNLYINGALIVSTNVAPKILTTNYMVGFQSNNLLEGNIQNFYANDQGLPYIAPGTQLNLTLNTLDNYTQAETTGDTVSVYNQTAGTWTNYTNFNGGSNISLASTYLYNIYVTNPGYTTLSLSNLMNESITTNATATTTLYQETTATFFAGDLNNGSYYLTHPTNWYIFDSGLQTVLGLTGWSNLTSASYNLSQVVISPTVVGDYLNVTINSTDGYYNNFTQTYRVNQQGFYQAVGITEKSVNLIITGMTESSNLLAVGNVPIELQFYNNGFYTNVSGYTSNQYGWFTLSMPETSASGQYRIIAYYSGTWTPAEINLETSGVYESLFNFPSDAMNGGSWYNPLNMYLIMGYSSTFTNNVTVYDNFTGNPIPGSSLTVNDMTTGSYNNYNVASGTVSLTFTRGDVIQFTGSASGYITATAMIQANSNKQAFGVGLNATAQPTPLPPGTRGQDNLEIFSSPTGADIPGSQADIWDGTKSAWNNVSLASGTTSLYWYIGDSYTIYASATGYTSASFGLTVGGFGTTFSYGLAPSAGPTPQPSAQPGTTLVLTSNATTTTVNGYIQFHADIDNEAPPSSLLAVIYTGSPSGELPGVFEYFVNSGGSWEISTDGGNTFQKSSLFKALNPVLNFPNQGNWQIQCSITEQVNITLAVSNTIYLTIGQPSALFNGEVLNYNTMAPIIGASLEITNINNQVLATATSGVGGSYSLIAYNITPESYLNLIAMASGYEQVTYEDLLFPDYFTGGSMYQNIDMYSSSGLAAPSPTTSASSTLPLATMTPSDRAQAEQESGNLDAEMLPILGCLGVLGILAAFVGRMAK